MIPFDTDIGIHTWKNKFYTHLKCLIRWLRNKVHILPIVLIAWKSANKILKVLLGLGDQDATVFGPLGTILSLFLSLDLTCAVAESKG